MKKIIIPLICLAFTVMFLCSSESYSLDGEMLFTSKCGKCHTPGGSAPVFGPVKYASIQWERFFGRSKHKRKKDISNYVSPEEIVAIKKYLIDHAADSDRPIAAGIR